jgi:adenosine kinase
MTFAGRFSDSLLPDQLDKVALSFIVDDLEIRRGGTAANISFGMGNLGLRPLLVGSVGEDFAEYRAWLERHGVDCSGIRTSALKHTARFVCTTDENHAQIASFYAGAMSESREIELAPLGADEPIDLVLIGPTDPVAILRHADECRARGLPFAADVSQQLAFADGDMIKRYIDGAAYLFSNDYEAGLIEKKTGWTQDEVLEHVSLRVTTHGEKGCVIDGLWGGERLEPLRVPVVPARQLADPTGVGDGFRAGFLAGLSWGLGPERCAQIGSALATLVIETVGPQEYDLTGAAFLARLAAAYGDQAAAEVEPHLRALRP